MMLHYVDTRKVYWKGSPKIDAETVSPNSTLNPNLLLSCQLYHHLIMKHEMNNKKELVHKIIHT